MNRTAAESTTAPAIAQPPARFDMYAQVHKGLRACMAATLAEAGRLDCNDNAEVKRVLDGIDQLLDWCAGHLDKENRFVHPAIAARDPGASLRMAEEHAHHDASIAQLHEVAEQLACASGAAREHAATQLYRQLAVFVAENLAHMETEESINNAILWAGYSDTELAEMHAAIVAATSPSQLALDIRWITPNVRPTELATLVRGLRATMPAEVFGHVIGMVQPHLGAPEWCRLMEDLGMPVNVAIGDPLALVERFIDATFVRFDAEAAMRLAAPDFVAHPWAAYGLPAGPAALQGVVAALGQAFDEVSATVVDSIVDGDRVSLRYVYAGRHVSDLFGIPATGRSFSIEGICIVRVDDGRVAEYWREEDLLGLYRQLGVAALLPADATTA